MRLLNAGCVLFLVLGLSGCVKDVNLDQITQDLSTHPIRSIPRAPTDGSTLVETYHPGLALVSSQVLGTSLTPVFRSRLLQQRALSGPRSPNASYVWDLDEKPLSDQLAQTKFMQQLVRSMVATANGDSLPDSDATKVKGKDFQKFVEAMSTDISSLYSDPHFRSQVGRMYGQDRVLTRQGMLFAYVKAYFNGKFVDRTGTTISRPTISMSGVPNSTITGLYSVFLEAFYDYTLNSCSPILYQKDKVVTYVLTYVPSPAAPDVFLQQYQKKLSNNWFTTSNLQPTAASFVPFEEVPDTSIGPGLSVAKVRYIRFVASLSGEKAKALSGLLFRLFGSVDLGFVAAFGKFNIGDNETLAKVLDTSFEVSARRLMEMATYQFFKTQDLSSLGIKDASTGVDVILQAFEQE